VNLFLKEEGEDVGNGEGSSALFTPEARKARFSRSLPSILPNINNKEGTYSATMEPEDDYGKQRILVPLQRIH